MPKFLKNVAGDLTEEATIVASTGATSAGKLAELDATGHFDVTVMPTGYGPDVLVNITAGEALAAGDLVYLDTTGKAYRADANSSLKAAQGYVLTSVAATALVSIYKKDSNTMVTGLTPGAYYFLSAATPGKLVLAANLPVGTGKIVQRVGYAQSATSLQFTYQQPIILA